MKNEKAVAPAIGPLAGSQGLVGSPIQKSAALGADGPPVRTRRHDPQRKDRIVEAALLVVAENGIAGTSLRRIAVKADVPLGSLTYHFAGMQDLLRAVFRKFIDDHLERLEGRLSRIADQSGVSDELLGMILEDPSLPSLLLTREFQALVLRDHDCMSLAREWIEGTTRVLEERFDPATARILEVLLDGLAFRRVTLGYPESQSLTQNALDMACAGGPDATSSVAPTSAMLTKSQQRWEG